MTVSTVPPGIIAVDGPIRFGRMKYGDDSLGIEEITRRFAGREGRMADRTCRVVQRPTGVVGQTALGQFIENPVYELAGVSVTNPRSERTRARWSGGRRPPA